MSEIENPHSIETPEQLDALFGTPSEAAVRKEVSSVHPCYRALIEASPFAVLATQGPGGLDASPRGDAPGFVVVEDEKQGAEPGADPRRAHRIPDRWGGVRPRPSRETTRLAVLILGPVMWVVTVSA